MWPRAPMVRDRRTQRRATQRGRGHGEGAVRMRVDRVCHSYGEGVSSMPRLPASNNPVSAEKGQKRTPYWRQSTRTYGRQRCLVTQRQQSKDNFGRTHG